VRLCVSLTFCLNLLSLSLKGAFELLCKKAEIQGLRFHDLRHTAATRMVEGGASIVAVSRILGHSDIRITMRYSHPENSLKEAVELLTKRGFSEPITDKGRDENS
jgi:integrase